MALRWRHRVARRDQSVEQELAEKTSKALRKGCTRSPVFVIWIHRPLSDSPCFLMSPSAVYLRSCFVQGVIRVL